MATLSDEPCGASDCARPASVSSCRCSHSEAANACFRRNERAARLPKVVDVSSCDSPGWTSSRPACCSSMVTTRKRSAKPGMDLA